MALSGSLLLSLQMLAQKTVTGCELVGGLQAELAADFTVTVGGSFINQGTVHYKGVTSFTNDGSVSEGTDGSCNALYASPCTTATGVAGANIFDNSVAATTIQGANALRMYAIDIDRNIQLDNEWQVASNFAFTSGLVTTDRTDLSHFLHFMDAASVSGNAAATHVDGYAAYSGNGAFTLPIGDGSKQLPAAVVGDCASTFKGAYFSTDPNAATLPAGAPFATANFEESLTAISTVEYWDVDGASSTTITLSFDATSNLAALSTNLSGISVAGWDGTEWVDLGNTAFTGTIGGGGTITSEAVIPDTYTAYTFAQRSGLLQVKVMLQGALFASSGGLMRDDLRAGGYIPLAEPYSTSGNARFAAVGSGGGEVTTTGTLNANAGTPDAIVDWVWVELRDGTNPALILDTKAALLQRDGDVVDAKDGTSALSFPGAAGSNFYISVKHRNHLGTMIATPVMVTPTGTLVDFISLSAAQIYNIPGSTNYEGVERAVEGGINALWAGNANADNKVKYQGGASDNGTILADVILFPGNTSDTYNYDNAFGYFYGDINMDGKVKYQGLGNDPVFVFLNVLSNYNSLNTGLLYNYDLFLEQLP